MIQTRYWIVIKMEFQFTLQVDKDNIFYTKNYFAY